jgi:GMP synthase (glutamine-hydrolysing)
VPRNIENSMRSVHVLQHAPLEGPGRIADIAREMGLGVTVHELFDKDAVPDVIPSGDLLLVMGGPMGVGDIGDSRWPFLAGEVDLLARLLQGSGAVLGICLGAQLMAHALGARVYPLQVGEPPIGHREVGWGPVTFVAARESEPSIAGLDESEVVLHWHGDTFDLPSRAVLLASTRVCPHQMFRFGGRAFGIQFHIEVAAEDVSLWVRDDAAFVIAANGPTGPERILADTARYTPRHRQVGDRMIRNILTTLLQPHSRSHAVR